MIPQHGRLEISASALRHNLALLQARLGSGVKVCATIKAEAYGHGVLPVGECLLKAGVEWFCFYSQEEAGAHMNWMRGVTSDVLGTAEPRFLALSPLLVTPGRREFFGDITPLSHRMAKARAMVSGQLRLTLVDPEAAAALDSLAKAAKSKIPVHIQFDAGLTRAGATETGTLALIRYVQSLRHLQLEGLFAHFSHGDEPGHAATAAQLAAFKACARKARELCPTLMLHLQNSGGVFHVADECLTMARVGIALYGLQPSFDHPIADLRPVARLVAPVLAIHDRPEGTGVGYGHTFITKRASRLAIVPVGYADGYPRTLSNRGVVQVRGKTAPVVGRVSMDQIIVDVTDVVGASVGDDVVVISNDPAQPNAIDRIAQECGTIGYEVATGFGSRLHRMLVE